MDSELSLNRKNKIFNIISGTIVAVCITLILILAFAFIIKLTNLSDNFIFPINQIINTMQETNSKHAIVLETLYKDNKEIFEKSSNYFFFVNPMYDNSLLLRNMFYIKYKKVKENDHIYLLDKFRKYKECFEFISKDEKETSIYLHSGGTTGEPKIISLSDYAINNLVDKIDDIVTISIKGKSMLAVLPIFHGFGLGMGVHGPLSRGASSALMMKFDVKDLRIMNSGNIKVLRQAKIK